MGDEQEVKTVVEEVGLKLEPPHPKRKMLTTLIQRAWSALWGWDGTKLRRLICDSSGRLIDMPVGSAGLPFYQNVSGFLFAYPVTAGGLILKAVAGGYQVVVPFVGCKEPDDRAQIDEAVSITHDFTVADDRLVEVRGPFLGTDSEGSVYDSDSAGGNNRLVGILTREAPLICFCKGRYLDVDSTTTDNSWSVLAWEI